MRNLTRRALRFLGSTIWEHAGEAASRRQTIAIHGIRLVSVLVRDVVSGQLTLRAMGLVYGTLLSLVPVLALSFSLLKAFGTQGQLEPLLLRMLEPLGPDGGAFAKHILQFIENVHVGVLGFAGLALLIYTAVSLIHKVEEAFNFIWHVPQSRSMGERFSRYLSVLLVGPLLVFAAIGTSATVAESEFMRRLITWEPVHEMYLIAAHVVPTLLVISAFAWVYMFVPNTRVRFVPALAGAALGGMLWQTVGWGFAQFVASSTQYAAIYSSFAVVILFLIWLYLSWLVLLLGASVAFYVDNPEYLVATGGEPRLSNRMRERLALSIMMRIARRYVRGEPPLTLRELSRMTRAPAHSVQMLLDILEQSGLLAQSGQTPAAYLPARELGAVTMAQFFGWVRAAGEDHFMSPQKLSLEPALEAILSDLDQAIATALGDITVLSLAQEMPEEMTKGVSKVMTILPSMAPGRMPIGRTPD